MQNLNFDYPIVEVKRQNRVFYRPDCLMLQKKLFMSYTKGLKISC